MARKQAVTQQDIDAAGNVAPHGRMVVYTIVVPGCDDLVEIERARRMLKQHGVREGLVHINVEHGIVSVPRLFTLWQGDAEEQAWQRAIQSAIPGCLIDVRDWEMAPGYPQGDIGTTKEASK